jgi:outer membrane murein-binding lipoprotein Lpp
MLAALIITAAVTAGTPDPKVDQAATDFKALSRIAQLSTNVNDQRQLMLAIVDNDLENMRERRPDESYRWASLQREETSRVKDQKSIERVYTEKELREVTITATNAYRLEVSVPTKQSLISKNNRVYIRNVSVDSTGFDGKLTHHEMPVDAWVNPGDSSGVALPEIGKNVKAMVELGIEAGGQHAVADVALLQAKLVDDPASPYFPIVTHLLKTREVLTQKSIDRGFLKTTVDESVLALPGEMEKRSAEMASMAERRKQSAGSIAPGDASPDVVAAVQEVARLLGGNLEDQTLARTKLQTLIDTLQGKPATPPATTTVR